MTIAKLHDGRTLKFDPNVPKHVIHSAIKETLAHERLEKQKRADAEAAQKYEMESRHQRERQESEGHAERRHKEGLQLAEKHHSDHVQLGKTQIQMHAAMAGGIEELSKSLRNIEGLPERLEKLSSTLETLGEKLEESTRLIVKAMKTPRKIVHDEKKRPIGMRLEEDE